MNFGGGGHYFCLKLIELKCPLRSRETTPTQRTEAVCVQHGGHAVTHHFVRFHKKRSCVSGSDSMFFFFSPADTQLLLREYKKRAKGKGGTEMKSGVGCDRPSGENL